MAILKLKAEKSDANEPNRIICFDKKDQKIATIYCDQCVKFETNTLELTLKEIEDIRTVTVNFNLFFDNLK